MAQTTVSFEMNKKLHDQLVKLCAELGMNIDDAFRLFAKKMVNEQKIPFAVTVNDIPLDDPEEKVFRFVKWTVIIATTTTSIALIAKLFRQLAHH